jgi:cell division protein FtsW
MTAIGPAFGRSVVGARRPGARPVRRAQAAGGWGTAQATVVAVVAALCVLGLAMVLSASSVYSLYEGQSTWFHFTRQAMWLSVGLVALLIGRMVPYQMWRRVVPLVVGVTLFALVIVLIPGIGLVANGSRRWIGIGGLTVQPSEGLKMALILYTADLLAKRSHELGDSRRTLAPPLLVFGIAAVLVLSQPDLGTVIIAGGIMVAVMFVGGVPAVPLMTVAAIGGAFATALTMTQPYRRARLLAFLDPWDDPLNTGYQTIQSMVGIASGGLTGVGVGEGRAKWGYLPFAHTDFIYATVAEEMGFIGASMILTLFVVLAVVGVRIAMRAPDQFGTLLAVGIVVWLVSQALVNIGAVVGVLPITGVPLPFVSFGGTSLVAVMGAVGILLNIGKQAGS